MKYKLLGLVHASYSKSHTVRVLELAKRLRNKNKFDIIISGSGPYMELAQIAGFKTLETKTLDEITIFKSLHTVLHRLYDENSIGELFNAEIELLREIKPDMIIRDYFREPAAIAAKYLNALDADNYIYDIKIQKPVDTPFFHYDFPPVDMPRIFRKIPYPILKIGSPIVEKIIRQKRAKPLHKKVKSLGLAVEKNTYEGVKADLTLLAESGFLYPSLNMDENYKFVGPLLVKEKHEIPPWLNQFKNNEKRVVITTGSTGLQERSQLFIDAFGGDNSYAVAFYCDSSQLPSQMPLNFFGNGRFDLNYVLADAEVFITHGGTGSIYTGLMNSVPIVSLYGHIEQHVNSFQLERYGAGIGIDHRDASPQVLRTAVDKIISDKSFKAKANKIGSTIDPLRSLDLAEKYILSGFEAKYQSRRKKYT